MRRTTFRVFVGIVATVMASLPAAAQEAGRPRPSAKDPRSAASIEKHLQYYLALYEDNLKSPDWIARAMGVISLARLDDPRSTQRLLEVLQKDATQIVQVFAFEALRARQDRLTPDQRAEWAKTGLAIGDAGAFRGELRVAYVRLLGEAGPTPENKKRFTRTFETSSALHPGDVRTIWALGDVLSEWRSADLARGLVGAMGKLDDAYRAELVLSRLGADVPHCSTFQSEGSAAMWAKTRQRWTEWLGKADLKELAPGQAAAYKDLSTYLPPGEKVADTSDERWKRDLELPRFRLGQLDLGIVLDTTGSMTAPLEWVKADAIKLMKAFELISREPRIGITLYRDRGDAYVARSLPLTSDAGALAAALRKETPHGGGDIPEAVLEGLTEALQNQKWSAGAAARRIVLLVGDAPPHEDSLKKIEELVTASAKSGFAFHTIKVRTDHSIEAVLNKPNYDPELAAFDRIAGWGDGNSLWVDFERRVVSPRSTSTAQPPDEDAPQRLLLREILTAALPKGYSDRVDPFVRILLDYLDVSDREVRQGFPAAAPSRPPPQGGGGGRPPARPRPPRDPQGR